MKLFVSVCLYIAFLQRFAINYIIRFCLIRQSRLLNWLSSLKKSPFDLFNSNCFPFHSPQLGPKKIVQFSLVEEKWKDLSLPKEQFDELVRVGKFSGNVEWIKFFALACSTLGEVSYRCLYHANIAVQSIPFNSIFNFSIMVVTRIGPQQVQLKINVNNIQVIV